VTNCHRLKLPASDGKNYLTDVATAETLLRLVQSVPSPKAEAIKLWLAKVGYERMQEMADPALSLNRARQTWQQHGRGRVDLHRAGRAVYPPDCRDHRRHRHATEQQRRQSWRWYCQPARKQLESQTGKSVVSGQNYLAPQAKRVPKPQPKK
jgi:hypothetical protein